jgi:hypothetical protein
MKETNNISNMTKKPSYSNTPSANKAPEIIK